MRWARRVCGGVLVGMRPAWVGRGVAPLAFRQMGSGVRFVWGSLVWFFFFLVLLCNCDGAWARGPQVCASCVAYRSWRVPDLFLVRVCVCRCGRVQQHSARSQPCPLPYSPLAGGFPQPYGWMPRQGRPPRGGRGERVGRGLSLWREPERLRNRSGAGRCARPLLRYLPTTRWSGRCGRW